MSSISLGQLKMVSVHSGKPICAPPCLSALAHSEEQKMLAVFCHTCCSCSRCLMDRIPDTKWQCWWLHFDKFQTSVFNKFDYISTEKLLSYLKKLIPIKVCKVLSLRVLWTFPMGNVPVEESKYDKAATASRRCLKGRCSHLYFHDIRNFIDVIINRLEAECTAVCRCITVGSNWHIR